MAKEGPLKPVHPLIFIQIASRRAILWWRSHFFVVWIILKKENRSFGDVSGIMTKFRILFFIALLIGYYLGANLNYNPVNVGFFIRTLHGRF